MQVVDGAEDSQWLRQAGLAALTEKVQHGSPITEADLREETVGFTAEQILAVKQRVDTLNEYVQAGARSLAQAGRWLSPQEPLSHAHFTLVYIPPSHPSAHDLPETYSSILPFIFLFTARSPRDPLRASARQEQRWEWVGSLQISREHQRVQLF